MNGTLQSYRLADRLKFALFRLLAPKNDNSHRRSWKLLRKFTSMLWLRPRPLAGMELLIDPTDWSHTVIYEEVFVLNHYDLHKVPFIPSTIIDCGAHIGMFSLLAVAAFPEARLVAFEPNPVNAGMIRCQIRRNSLKMELVEAAVSTTAGEQTFVNWNSHSGHLRDAAESARSCKVRTVDFPDFIRRLEAKSLLLKMDVEGEEEKIFPAMLPYLPNQCVIFFETHSGDPGWETASCLLASEGFAVEKIGSKGDFCDGYASRV